MKEDLRELKPKPIKPRGNTTLEGYRRDVAAFGESLEQTRSDVRRTRSEVTNFQERTESHMRRTRILSVIAIFLVGILAGLTWMGAAIIRDHKELLGNVPAFRTTLEAIAARVNSAETRLNVLVDDRAQIVERMVRIEKTAVANLGIARNQAGALVTGIKNEIGQSIQALQGRLTGVESTQREAGEEIDRLQSELASVRDEMINLREENTREMEHVQQLQQAQQSTQTDLLGLDRRLVSNQSRVDTLSYQVDRRRVDFNLPKDRTEQVAENVFLTVKQTDVKGQRINGWLQTGNDGRVLQLRNEGPQHPVVFSGTQDERPYQLVFTRVDKTGVSGYVLVPNSGTGNALAEK